MNRVLVWSAVVLVAMGIVGSPGFAQAATLFQHSGATPVTTEGFSQYMSPAGTTYQGAGSEFGTPCWYTYATPGDSEFDYMFTAAQITAMTTDGWTLTTKAYDWWSVPNAENTNSVCFQVQTPGKLFQVNLGTTGDSGGGLQLASIVGADGSLIQVASSLTNAWHTYTISQAAGATIAKLSIDGGDPITMEGLSGTWTPQACFGSFSSGASGYGEWAQITLATNAVPEPSSVAMFVSSIFGLAAYAWRKRR